MPAIVEPEGARLHSVLEKMMKYALLIYRYKKGLGNSAQSSEEDLSLSSNLKLCLRDALHQLENSAMLSEYVELNKVANSREKLTECMRRSFTLHENPNSKTDFMEWVSFICIIAIACHEDGCADAMSIGIEIIKERCKSEERLDQFRKLGCDV